MTPEDEPFSCSGAPRAAPSVISSTSRGSRSHRLLTRPSFGTATCTCCRRGGSRRTAVIALPSLWGSHIDGVPQTREGFVLVDVSGRVEGVPDVYAAGDITRFPVKQGGIAAQQADAAAQAIAAAAGPGNEPRPFRPILRGLLLTGSAPRFLGGTSPAGDTAVATIEPLWWPPAKLVGRYLGPFLAELASTSYEIEPPARPARSKSSVGSPQTTLPVSGRPWKRRIQACRRSVT